MTTSFIYACGAGILGFLKTFDLDTIDIHAQKDHAFRRACCYGRFEVAKWLIEISKERKSPIDIHAVNDHAFRFAYRNGKHKIARWLLTFYTTKYIKENLFDCPSVRIELKNRERSKLHLFIYLSKNEKIKKLLDMHAINIIFEYI